MISPQLQCCCVTLPSVCVACPRKWLQMCDQQIYRACHLMLTLNLSNLQQHRRLWCAFRIRTLQCKEGRFSLDARGRSPPSFDTATSCVGALAVGLLTFFLQNMALLVPREFSRLFSSVSENGVNFFEFVSEEPHECLSNDVRLVIGSFCLPLLLCFLFSTFGKRRPHFWPNRFRYRCDMNCWSIGHLPMNNLSVDVG